MRPEVSSGPCQSMSCERADEQGWAVPLTGESTYRFEDLSITPFLVVMLQGDVRIARLYHAWCLRYRGARASTEATCARRKQLVPDKEDQNWKLPNCHLGGNGTSMLCAKERRSAGSKSLIEEHCSDRKLNLPIASGGCDQRLSANDEAQSTLRRQVRGFTPALKTSQRDKALTCFGPDFESSNHQNRDWYSNG